MPSLTRILSYFKERALPVSLLWICIAAGYRALPNAVLNLLDVAGDGGKFELTAFVDARLLLLLGFGFVALLAVFAIVEKGLSFGPREHANRSEFFDRLWDEISGAASHIGAGAAAMWFLVSSPKSPFPWVTVAWIILAVFAFRQGRREDGADVVPQCTPAQRD